ncbi:YqjD family protein [Pusillimonas sp.]|uniref:YqjD family protein n=1 Tax=Pusillimonas sp. TaxID=3040095 RepID=UPI0037CC819A
MARNSLRDDVSEKRDEVASNIKDLISSADDLLRSTAAYSGAEIEAARDRLKVQLELARKEAGSYRQSLKESYHAVSRATDECVHKHAWTAVCVAGVIGLLMGKCLSSGHSRR